MSSIVLPLALQVCGVVSVDAPLAPRHRFASVGSPVTGDGSDGSVGNVGSVDGSCF